MPAETMDVAVLGAGPAGMAAAAAAVSAGARVAVLDDHAAGGLAGAVVYGGSTVWGVAGGPGGPFRLDAVRGAANLVLHARALVVATGAHERWVPFAGADRPGVMGLAEAQARLAAGAALGRRTVLAGCGPLLAELASAIMRAGGSVVAVVDLAASANAPRAWLPRAMVMAAEGAAALSRVRVMGLEDGSEQVIDCDSLCIGYGVWPAMEAAAVLRASVTYAPDRGGWAPVLDPVQRTTVPRLYIAGDAGGIAGVADDAAGVAGAERARVTGRLAGLAAAHDLGLAAAPEPAPPAPAAFTPGADLLRCVGADAVVCPCEGLTRTGIEAALAAGAANLDQLKQFTRCGMGACQGRRCGEVVAELVAQHVGGRVAAGRFTPRIPLRAVPMAPLLGRFQYSDIPVPAPAPI